MWIWSCHIINHVRPALTTVLDQGFLGTSFKRPEWRRANSPHKERSVTLRPHRTAGVLHPAHSPGHESKGPSQWRSIQSSPQSTKCDIMSTTRTQLANFNQRQVSWTVIRTARTSNQPMMTLSSSRKASRDRRESSRIGHAPLSRRGQTCPVYRARICTCVARWYMPLETMTLMV